MRQDGAAEDLNGRRLRALLERSFDAAVLLDAGGTIRYASPAATRVMGHPPEDLVGQPGLTRVHPDDLAPAREQFGRLVQTPGASFTNTFRVRHKDGSWRWIEGVGTNLLADPAVGAVVVNYRDVTERERAAEALADLAAAVAHTADTVMVCDRDGRIEHVNPAFERLTGYPQAEVAGQTPRLLKSTAHGPAFYEALWRTILSGEAFRGVFTNRKKNGELYALVFANSGGFGRSLRPRAVPLAEEAGP